MNAVSTAVFETPLAVRSAPGDNTTNLLLERIAATPDRVLFSRPAGDGWTDVTAAEFHAQVVALAKGFVAAGLQPGERVGLMARTTYEWTLIDFAMWFAGGVLVPVYETSSSAQLSWELRDSEAVGLLVESGEHLERYEEVQADLPDVRVVWQIGSGALDDLVARGVDVPDAEIERRRSLAGGDDTATLIYTSGSTGRPKGCVITHANFVELSRNAAVVMPEIVDGEGASTLLFITLAHVFARMISVLALYRGVRVGHQPDTRNLLPALASFRPTFLLAVPRVFEKVYNAAEQNAEGDGHGGIFRKASAVAVAHSKARDAGRVPLRLALAFRLYDRLVYRKLRAVMGGKVTHAVSGSAPLGERLGHFYRSLGVTILEGYGLTETTAPASVNVASNCKIGTVGPPLPGTGIRIVDGEIEVRGVGVFAGYWKNDEATATAFDDGWFRTGDLGSLDDDGYLTITGRTKEIIVTAGGKNVSPAALEDPVRANPLVGQVVVVGDQRPFIGALVTLDSEILPTWLEHHGQDAGLSLAQAAENPAVLAEIQSAIDAANTSVSRAESIRKFVVLPTEFTEASGHLTPKLSIKRHVILNDFADAVAEMYASSVLTQGIGVIR